MGLGFSHLAPYPPHLYPWELPGPRLVNKIHPKGRWRSLQVALFHETSVSRKRLGAGADFFFLPLAIVSKSRA